MFPSKNILSALVFAHAAVAAIHDVQVGATGLSFTPNVTTAAKGDTVVFHFYSGHHNAVQGDFSSPCTFANGGFYSGYNDPTSGSGPSDNVFAVTINDTNPIWYYCSPHCEIGMVGVINPPSSGNTLDAFLAGAKSARGATVPAAVQGGVVEAAGAVSSSAASSASSAATSASSTPSSSTASASAAQTSASASGTGSSSAAQTASTTPASSSSTTSASASAKPNGAVAVSAQNVAGLGFFAFIILAVSLTGLI